MAISHKTHMILRGQERELQDAVRFLLQQDAFFFDIESVGDHRLVAHLNDVSWISISSYGLDLVIPMKHPIGDRIIGYHKEPRADKNGKIRNFRVPDYENPPDQIDRSAVFEILEPVFMSPDIRKLAHNLPFDIPSIAKYLPGLPPGPYEDTQNREWLVNENRRGQYALKQIDKRRFGVVYDTEDTGKRVEIHPLSKVAHYSYMDSHTGWMIYRAQEPQLRAKYGDDKRPERLEESQLGPICRMKLRGIPVNVPRLTELQGTLSSRLVVEEAEVYKAAGREFNLNSGPQKQWILYGPEDEGCQGLEGWKLTDGGKKKKEAGEEETHLWYSTDDDALESFYDNKLCQSLRTYSTTHKLLTGFVDSWLGVEGDPKKATKIFGDKLFTTFKNAGTFTGRYSSSSPNVQNIPRPDGDPDSDATLIRSIVEADEDYRLVVADWSQIEPVVMAHFIGHGLLYDGFMNGIDPYIINAAAALGIDVSEVTKEQRQKFGKTLFLAMGFGARGNKIAVSMGVSPNKANQILKGHERRMPEVYEYKDSVVKLARGRKPPHIKTILGRKRTIADLNASENWIRWSAERRIFNSLIQGSAADLMKMAIDKSDQEIERLDGTGRKAWLAATIHDELIAVAHKDYAADVRDIMVDAMTGEYIQKLVKVPLRVDPVICTNWAQAK